MASKNKQETTEDQLSELTRKYRIMENDRRAYSEETQSIIRKQRASIEKLKKENETMKEELLSQTRGMSSLNSVEITNRINKLNDAIDALARKIEMEKRTVDELDDNIRRSNGQLLELRAAKGGVYSSGENNALVQKQIKVLENRLDKALVKFNEALAYNKELRETIDNLRRERVVFDNIYKKLEKELHDKKREMASIIEAANIAYEERDQSNSDLMALKAQSEKELVIYEDQLKNLDMQIEGIRRQKEMLKAKERERKDKEVLGDLSAEEEAKLKKKAVKGNWALAHQKVVAQENAEKVQSYEEAFNKIRQATAIEDIDELVNRFIAAEEQNFSLFNYVNELNNEIEKLEESVVELGADVERHRAGTQASSSAPSAVAAAVASANLNATTPIAAGGGEGVRKRALKDLEEKLANTESRAEHYEERFDIAMRTINALKGGIQSLFTKLGCSIESSAELLGSTGVTESNMLQYLGIVEQRVNDLVMAYAEVAPDAGREASSPVSSVRREDKLLSSQPLIINPPTTGDDFDEEGEEGEEDDDDRPLTRAELQAKTAKLMTKREQKKAPQADRSKVAGGKGKSSKAGKGAAK